MLYICYKAFNFKTVLLGSKGSASKKADKQPVSFVTVRTEKEHKEKKPFINKL
jgi:hypothetical protein